MKACIVSFIAPGAPGTVLNVPNIIDSAGNPFVGHTLIPVNLALLGFDTITAVGGAYGLNIGADTGVIAGSAGDSDVSQFGVKICSGGQSTNRSIVDVRANAFFGGDMFLLGKVTSWNLGSVDLLFDFNLTGAGGSPIVAIVLGGVDLVVDVNNFFFNGVYTTSGPAVGVLNLPITGGLNSSAGAANGTVGAGGSPVGIGWDTRDSGRGAITHHVITQAGNKRQQRSDACYIYPDLPLGLPVVTTWGPTSYTITGASGGASSVVQLAFSGVGIQARAGVAIQPTSPGPLTIQTGLTSPKLFIIASYGAASGLPTLTDAASFSLGFCDRTRQADIWTAEYGTSPTVNGARRAGITSLLRFGISAGAGTVFTAVASLASMSDGGAVVLNWSAADATARELLWFALGDSDVPVVPGVGCVVPQGATATAPTTGCSAPLPPTVS